MLRSGIIISIFTLLSRVFGLARELFIAYCFGAGAVADCVNVAFKTPNLLRRIFGEGALTTVFIPIFNKKLTESTTKANIFSGKVTTILLITLILIVILAEIFMPQLMIILAPGFFAEADKFELAVLLCRITMPYIIFIAQVALLGGILNSVGNFGAFAFVPIIMNIVIIGYTYFAGNEEPQIHIALSVIIAGFCQLLFMMYFMYKAGLSFWPQKINYLDQDLNLLAKNMLPATMSAGAGQLNIFLSQSIASFIPGAVSILSYADRLYQFPLAIIGVSFSSILLPKLSKTYANKEYHKANIVQNNAIKFSLALSIPAMIGLALLAHPIIHIVYERGAFSAENTEDTAQILTYFAFGLPAFILAKIFMPIFYANLDTKTPYRITLYYTFINCILNIILVTLLGKVGIAIGTSIASWINVYLLYIYSKKYVSAILDKQSKIFFIKIIIASLAMIGVILVGDYWFGKYLYSTSTLVKTTTLLLIVTASAGIYLFFMIIQQTHKHILLK